MFAINLNNIDGLPPSSNKKNNNKNFKKNPEKLKSKIKQTNKNNNSNICFLQLNIFKGNLCLFVLHFLKNIFEETNC